MMPYALFQCHSTRCGKEFRSWDKVPECPHCGSVKVTWVPGIGGIIGKETRFADATLRSIAQSYGLTNLKSARAGESAHPGLPTPKQQGTYKPAPGFEVPWSNVPTAGFSPTPPKLRRAFEPGSRFPGRRPLPKANVRASWNPPPGTFK